MRVRDFYQCYYISIYISRYILIGTAFGKDQASLSEEQQTARTMEIKEAKNVLRQVNDEMKSMGQKLVDFSRQQKELKARMEGDRDDEIGNVTYLQELIVD